jgi:cardiolipin synthase
MSALEALAKAGAVVLGFKWLHAKALVVDQREAMVMSANFQKHGLDEGFELGIVIEDDRLEELLQALQIWQTQAQWQLQTDAKLGEVLGLVQIWDGKSLNECDVKESRVIDLGETPSSSAEYLQAPRPNLPRIDKLAEPVHELKYEWRVVAPRLANGAKEEYQQIVETDGNITKGKKQKTKQVTYNPRVYKQPNGQRVVAIKASQDLASARRLKTELKLAAIVLE